MPPSLPADLSLDDLHAEPSTAVEDVLVATVKALGHTTPAPRDDPFYGLDRSPGLALPLLARLSRHGDFRKYVLVLDAGAGLGGSGRWLAFRYGCRVVALDVSHARLRLGARLSARAGVGDRMRALAGSFGAIPVRNGAFTQIWSVEALHHATDLVRAIGELHRVLRPGSPLALQEIVRRSAAVPARGLAHHTTEEYLAALDTAGFDAVDHEDVTAERRESSPVILSVRERFARVVADRIPDDMSWRRTATVDALVASGDYRIVHFFARRPST